MYLEKGNKKFGGRVNRNNNNNNNNNDDDNVRLSSSRSGIKNPA